jgi:hypothetical protein
MAAVLRAGAAPPFSFQARLGRNIGMLPPHPLFRLKQRSAELSGISLAVADEKQWRLKTDFKEKTHDYDERLPRGPRSS